jgi:hypothetical protein
MAVLAVAVGTIAAAAPAADRVLLRGGAPDAEGTVTAAGAAGVELSPAGGGPSRTIPWSAVRSVDAAAPPEGIDRWKAAGEDLWRGRLRADRGDWRLALEPLLRAARAWSGAAPSADGLAAAAASAEALVRAGRRAEAVRPAFDAIRALRAQPALAETLSGPARDALGRFANAEFPVPPALPPVLFDAAASARVREDLEGFDCPGDAALTAVVAAYVAALDPPAVVTVRLPPKPTAAERAAADGLAALRDAASADPRVRATAVATLLAPPSGRAASFEGPAMFAAGRALASDPDAPTGELGRVLLAAVAATPGPAGDGLSRRAEAEFGACTLAPPKGGSAAAIEGALPPQAQRAVPEDLADAAAAWLEERGEVDLLVAHLEGQVARTPDAATRAGIVARIASLMASRLELEADGARRGELLDRALALVRRYGEGSEELRLAILRSQYRAAQRAAEDRRAGRGTDEACAVALAQLRDLVKDLGELARSAERARGDANRTASFQVGAKADDFLARAARAEQIAQSAQYFRAWSSYYAAWLGRELDRPGWRTDANTAVASFAGLIEPGKATIAPGEVSLDLRGNEPFASAILGSALSYAIIDAAPACAEWFALLEPPNVHPSVRDRLGAWRMVAALDLGDVPAALAALRSQADGPQSVAASLIAAARAGRSGDPAAAELLSEAVGNLAAAGQLRALSSVVIPDGAVVAGPGARLIAAVRAVVEANARREAGDRAAAEAAWDRAAKDLAAAAVPDAPPAVAAGARALRAFVLRSAGRLAEAADAYLAAAAQVQGERAGDARWSAVLCLDELARGSGADARSAADRRDREIAAISADLPGTGAAVRAAAWRVVHDARPSSADIDALLSDAVPVELSPAARRAALEGLYRRFSAATGDERLSEARRALAVGDGVPAGAGSDGVASIRRRLELAVAAADRVRAEDALAALEARVPEESMADAQRDELRARRVQVAVIAGDVDRARADFERLPRDGAWTRAAARSLADATFTDPSAPPELRASVARAIVLGTAQPPQEDLVRWIDAESALLRAGAAAVDAEGAARAIAAALAASPDAQGLLLADAAFRSARGDLAGAARSVRAVLARAAAGTPDWFAAKALQVEALAAEDPRKARAVLDQVRRLGNGFGPGPAGDRLRSFDQSLPPAASAGEAR